MLGHYLNPSVIRLLSEDENHEIGRFYMTERQHSTLIDDRPFHIQSLYARVIGLAWTLDVTCPCKHTL